MGRTTSHRKATMKNLAVALFTHGAIETTLAKAKELRRFAEPLITLARTDTVANRRRAFAALRDHSSKDELNGIALKRLFGTIATTYADRPGGYTRILKLGNRKGDAAAMSRIELVDIGEYKEED